MRNITHFIDGASVAGTSGHFGDIFNPNTGEVQARVALAVTGLLYMALFSMLAEATPGMKYARFQRHRSWRWVHCRRAPEGSLVHRWGRVLCDRRLVSAVPTV